jgi:outer membrane protein assembly factor BamB
LRDPLPHVRKLERVRRLPVALLVAMVFLLPGAAALGQTPGEAEWSQFQGDATHSGVASSGPEPPYEEAWTFNVEPKDQEGASAAVIADGLAITAGPEALYGVDLSSGEQRWSVPRDGPPAPPAIAVDGDRTLVLFTDGRDADGAVLRAIDLQTQEDAWDAPAVLGAVSRTGVTVDGGLAFVADGDGTVYAVDVATGTESWTTELAGEPKGPMPVADGMVFAVPLDPDFSALAASVVALEESSGETAWTYDMQPPSSFSSLPAVGGGWVVVVSPSSIPNGGELRALATEDGSVAWSARLSGYVSPWSAPAVAGDAVYAADFLGAGLHAFEPSTAAQLWQFEFNERVLRSSPVMLPDHVLVGLSDGSLGAVDRTTGRLVWQSSPQLGLIGHMAVTSDLVVAVRGAKDGGLVAFRHDDAGSLIDVASPTIPRYGVIVGRWAIAFLGVGVAVLVPLTLVVRRVGSPELVREDGDSDDEEYEDDEDDEDGDAP